MAWSWRRKIALWLLVLPPAVFLPFGSWVFHEANGWLVSLDLEPEHREAHLAEIFVCDYVSFAVVVLYVSLLLLFLDGFHRKIVAILLMILSVPALAGLAMLAITATSFFQFR